MADSSTYNLSKINEHQSEENEDLNCQKKQKNSITMSDQQDSEGSDFSSLGPNIDDFEQLSLTDANVDYNNNSIGQTVNNNSACRFFDDQCTLFYEKNFKELEKLGSGGFGKVYAAEHKIDDVQYAIKKIKINSHNTNKIQQSYNEVKIIAQLNHPNIVTYKTSWREMEPFQENDNQSSSESSQTSSDCGSSYDSESIKTEPKFTLYIQMSLCKMTLHTWMQERTEPSEELIIKIIAKQVFNALNYIHQLGIVHHDIKPHNILITDPNKVEIKIADFGLAHYLLKKKYLKYCGGTPLYGAPELINLPNECNTKNDIYSVGIVILELVYPMKTTSELYRKIEEITKGNDIPSVITNNYPFWGSIIRKTIIQKPQERASAEDLLNIIIKEDKQSRICETCSQFKISS